MLHHQGRSVKTLRREGRQLSLLIHQNRQIYPGKRLDLGPVPHRIVSAVEATWFEFAWSSNELLTGTAATGWTDARGLVTVTPKVSEDLATWTSQVIDAPGSPELQGDGSYLYWVRGTVPLYWEQTLCDFTLASNRYGKSVTSISLLGVAISLPGYPYALPAQKAALQADLRTAGYAGATVTSSTAAISVQVRNHISTGTATLQVTMSGANVTAVAPVNGTTISLPGYPYAMPSQQATLQAALRTAGYAGAVVMLFGDPWQIFIPDRLVTGNLRPFNAEITPGDPYPGYDFFGAYVGIVPATGLVGTQINTRTPAGLPLEERKKQFGRFGIAPPA